MSWLPVLVICFSYMFWLHVLVACSGCMFWLCVLVTCSGYMFWLHVLVTCPGCISWLNALVECPCWMSWLHRTSAGINDLRRLWLKSSGRLDLKAVLAFGHCSQIHDIIGGLEWVECISAVFVSPWRGYIAMARGSQSGGKGSAVKYSVSKINEWLTNGKVLKK